MSPSRLFPFLTAVVLMACIPAHAAEPESTQEKSAASTSTKKKPALDRSGKARRGKASYYGKQFYGRKMADGTPMDPRSNVAASRTLPLGTKAKVTNLENGKSDVVEIKDRGPYVEGRIVDLSPQSAEKLDITKQGVAPVEVKPIEIPKSGDSGRNGDADSGKPDRK